MVSITLNKSRVFIIYNFDLVIILSYLLENLLCLSKLYIFFSACFCNAKKVYCTDFESLLYRYNLAQRLYKYVEVYVCICCSIARIHDNSPSGAVGAGTRAHSRVISDYIAVRVEHNSPDCP